MDRTQGGDGATGRRIAMSGALLLVVLAGALTLSSALFSDTTTVTGNSVGAGTVDLTAVPAAAVFEAEELPPGATVHRSLVLENTGTLDLRHAMTSITAGDGRLDQLVELTVRAGVRECTAASFGSSGTVLYGPGPLGTTAGMAVYGDATTGDDAGDRVLRPGDIDELCLRVSLSDEVDAEQAGATIRATFTFESEQTANNP